MPLGAVRWWARGRLVTPSTVLADGWVLVERDRIAAVGSGAAPAGTAGIDLGDRMVTPGLVDLHVHGGGGHQVRGADPAEVAAAVAAIGRHHLRHGTTAWVPTTVSEAPARLLAAAAGVALARRRAASGSPVVLGLHLEGPWLAPVRAGAHDPTALRRPDPDELGRLVAAAEGGVRIVTFAPELPGADQLLAAGVAAGITMAVGHTDADADTTAQALVGGARHVTHLGNAMPVLDRRRPGPVAAALTDRSATLEVIADGIHLHPAFLRLVATLAPERMVAVTDATAACGLAPGRHLLGGTDIEVDAGGRSRLAARPDVLAGSTLTMDRALAGLIAAGVDPVVAVRAATATPARVAGAHDKGRLEAGADADLVVFDPDGTAAATVIGGRVAHDPHGLLEQVPAG